VHSSGNLLADRRYEYAQALRADKEYEAAHDLLKQTAELVPRWAPVWFALGETSAQMNDPESAIKAFEMALKMDQDDILGAGLRLAHLKGDRGTKAMSLAYVASLFDDYADRFDDHLVSALEYRGPQITLDALKRACAKHDRPFHFRRAIDLGCGTGLMAVHIHKNIDEFIGIDLSRKMVENARKTGFYTDVYQGELIQYLAKQKDHSVDLLTAADVLVYLGDLEPLFQHCARTLNLTGVFAFTLQSHDGANFMLGNDLRYHHSESYLRIAASNVGLTVEICEPCVTRRDAGEPVRGFVVVLAHPLDS
jgi:predicted TPR repeat methyltransferase